MTAETKEDLWNLIDNYVENKKVLSAEVTRQAAEIERQKRELHKYHVNINGLQTELDDANERIAELEARVAELEKTIELSGTISNYAQETIESAQRKRIAELESALRQWRKDNEWMMWYDEELWRAVALGGRDD